jgi:divalent metal cation (Fe/Co/Zn/Cd) transporter
MHFAVRVHGLFGGSNTYLAIYFNRFVNNCSTVIGHWSDWCNVADRYGWRVADPICSFAISVLIIASSMPLLHELTGMLTQRTPDNIRRRLGPCLDNVC